MSSTPTYATPGLAAAPAAATTNFFVAAVILVLFVLSAAVSAQRKDITQGFDEVAHASYVAHIQHSGDAWPDLNAMRMLDPQSFRFTATANYLNHPPPYYALLAAIGPQLEGRPQALVAHRLIDVAIAALGFAALLGLGLAARLPRYEFYAFAVPFAGIAVSLRRLWQRQESTLDAVIIAGTIAIAATLAVHVIYSYGRHLSTGWLMDAYPRYYLPLAVIVPLAGLSLLTAVAAPRRRAALLVFLIAGPALFRIFGAPLG